MRRPTAILILALAPMLAACASIIAPQAKSDIAALRAGDYALDGDHTAVLFRIDHLGFSDYVGRFEVVDASLIFDDAAPEQSTLEAIVDIASLDVAND